MAVKAAISGQGVVLGYSGYVEAEIAAGALVRPFDLIVPISRGYHLSIWRSGWPTQESAPSGIG